MSRARAAGRPPGQENTRAEIIRVAREAFATNGYEATSVRAVAQGAGVDPSTAIHFFGSKEGLFRAVIDDVVPATKPLTDAIRRKAPGEELVRHYLGIWEDAASGQPMQALIRASIASERSLEMLREALISNIVGALPGDDRLAAELVLTQLAGLGIGRFIARFPEVSRAGVDEIASRVGPVLDHYRGISD